MAKVAFDHVTERCAEGVEAVKAMRLTVEEGESMILVGPSGSGRCTALEMVAGLEAIVEGQIRTGDEVVGQHPPRLPRPDEQGDDAVVDWE